MKSILIIDTPEDCGHCRLSDFVDGDSCLCRKADRKSKYNEKPSWCPLIPLPKKFNEGIEYDMDGFGFDKYLETGFKMGWDAYYDKITKNHIGENTEKVCNDDLYENWMFFDKGETE